MRLIDADLLEPDADYDDGEYWAVSMTQIQNVPTIEERKKGHWIFLKNGNAICSECGFEQVSAYDWDNWDNFCHHCGTDMREWQE